MINEIESKSDEEKKSLNFTAFRMGQDFASVSVKPVLTRIACRKPNKTEFFRTHLEFEFPTAVFEDTETREVYLVSPSLWTELGNDLKKKIFVLCTNRSGVPFIWAITAPDPERSSSWTETAMAAAQLGKQHWVRIKADMAAQAYEVVIAENLRDVPTWPEKSVDEILELTFKNRIIDNNEHPILRKLRGEL